MGSWARPGAKPTAEAKPLRLLWAVFGSAYLAFVVYGSLVPLAYRHVPWEEAVGRWLDMPFLDLGIDSRADWVANLLLFIPLAFFWSGALLPRRARLLRAVTMLVFVGAGFVLALAIEFAQMYFPPRTVSINDVAAETLGAALGVAAWGIWGGRIERWLHTLPLARGTSSVAQRLLVAYLLVFFGYNLLPLDLTISPAEVYHKWSQGKVVLIPFAAAYSDKMQMAYDLLTDVAIWIPIAALWQLADRRPGLQVWAFTVLAAIALELLQLFVFSRITDVTDVVTAGLGAGIGVALVRSKSQTKASEAESAPIGRGVLSWLAAILLWLGVLAVVFWYPFDFNFDRNFLRTRVTALGKVPFEAYYYGSEFRAITEVLHKTLFMAPLGVMLHGLFKRLPPVWPRPLVHAGAVLLVAACAAGIEVGQLFLPTKTVDLADWLLEFLGGAIGYAASVAIFAQTRPPPGRSRD